MAGIGQQGQRIGAETEDHLSDDEQAVERRRHQEAPAEIGRRMVMVPMPMMVPVAVAMAVRMPVIMTVAVRVVVVVVVVVVMIMGRLLLGIGGVIVSHGCTAKRIWISCHRRFCAIRPAPATSFLKNISKKQLVMIV